MATAKHPTDAQLVSDDKGEDLIIGTYDDGSFFLACSRQAPRPIRAKDAKAIADYITEKIRLPQPTKRKRATA